MRRDTFPKPLSDIRPAADDRFVRRQPCPGLCVVELEIRLRLFREWSAHPEADMGLRLAYAQSLLWPKSAPFAVVSLIKPLQASEAYLLAVREYPGGAWLGRTQMFISSRPLEGAKPGRARIAIRQESARMCR